MALALAPSPALAQRDAYEAEQRIGRLLDDARSYYDNLELEQADAALADAVRLGQDFRVGGRVMAEVYIQRGILMHVRDKDADAARREFVEALRVDDRIRLDPLVSTPTLQRIFEEAQREAGAGRDRYDDRRDRYDDRRDRYDDRRDRYDDRREPPPPPPRPRPADDIKHDPIRNARGGQRLPVIVDIGPELNPYVYRVHLYFRSARADAVQKLEMRPDGPRSFVARIPGRFIAGRTLSYYVVVEDRSGKTVASVRSAKDPIIVRIEGDSLAGLDEIPSGSSLTGGGDDDDDWDDEGGGKGKRQYVTIGLSVGTGAGFITELAEPQNQKSADISPGLAFAPLHLLAELDAWPTDWLALGAFGRLQLVEFAIAAGGRLKLRVVNDGGHQLLLRGGGGFGRVRHLVDLGEVLDTTLEGPYFYTLGLTYAYAFNDTWAFLFTPDFLHMIGNSPSPHVDIQLGVQAGF